MSSTFSPGQSAKGPSAVMVTTGAFPVGRVMVVQTGSASEGLLRQWDRPDLGVDKHHGYAFQWFSLSALLVVLYVWFQWIAPRRKKRADD